MFFKIKRNPKDHFTTEIAKVRPILAINFIFVVNIWEHRKETEKTNGFW